MKAKAMREKRTRSSLLWPSTLLGEEAVQVAVRTLSKDLVARRWERHQARNLLREVAPPAVNLQEMFGAPSPRSARKIERTPPATISYRGKEGYRGAVVVDFSRPQPRQRLDCGRVICDNEESGATLAMRCITLTALHFLVDER